MTNQPLRTHAIKEKEKIIEKNGIEKNTKADRDVGKGKT